MKSCIAGHIVVVAVVSLSGRKTHFACRNYWQNVDGESLTNSKVHTTSKIIIDALDAPNYMTN
nr:MAG TPA: hypothetical protein [Caudoviricetes sp.]